MSAANRQHRPTAELRAIQPASPQGLALILPSHRPYSDEEAATVLDNRRKYGGANWRHPARAERRRMGLKGRGFQRLTAASGYKVKKGDRHISAPVELRKYDRHQPIAA